MAAKKIVIFDDEADILRVTEARLKKNDFEVVCFDSSRNALEDIKREMPDLILLDISMPYKDGYQVCDEVRCDESVKHIPVIVFTAQPIEKNFIDKAYYFYGATDYVAKPFNIEELVEKIKKHLKF